MKKNLSIGADIGGSHITCAAVDLEKEQIIPGTAVTRNVNNHAPAAEILDAWAIALRQCIQHAGAENLAGIGFAMPGPFDYARGIARFTKEVQKYEHLCGVDVATALASRLGLPSRDALRFMNDASAFAVGEAWLGEARNVRRAVCITLGTGFGSAFIRYGLPVTQGDDVPKDGCVWHLPWMGGIADDSFSTRWFVNEFAVRTGKQVSGAKELSEMAGSESAARDLFRKYGEQMGLFLGPWLARFGAEALVIGGNIAGAWDLFGNYLEDSLKSQNLHLLIRLSRMKEEAAIAGSARMADDGFWKKIFPVIQTM